MDEETPVYNLADHDNMAYVEEEDPRHDQGHPRYHSRTLAYNSELSNIAITPEMPLFNTYSQCDSYHIN